MKVLHVLCELRPSGAEVMLKVAAPLWKQYGVNSEILGTGETEGPYAPDLRDAGYVVHHLPFSKSPGHLWRYYRFLREQRYDVVHVHSERAMVYYATLARAAGVRRVVRTIHGAFRFEGMLRHRRKWQRWLLRRLGVVDASIGESVKAIEWEYFRNPTTIVPNWFDDQRFRPPTEDNRKKAREFYGISPDQRVVVTVGNCAPVKNHRMMLDACALLARDCDLLYLHAGIEEAESPERELASRLGLKDRVRFLGSVSDVPELLATADVYVMCSLNEGFSIAALEALGAGTPAVFTDVPGLRDLRPLSSALVWSQLTAESLAEATRRVLDLSEAQRRKIGQELSLAVHKCYGPARGVSAYIDLYRNPSPFSRSGGK